MWLVLIALAASATFWNSLYGPFIWDDRTAVVQNDTLRQLWSFPGALSPPDETPVAGRPLANLSLAVNYAIGGEAVAGYHAVNIAFHLACAMLLFAVVRRTLRGRRLRERWGERADSTAFVAALLWAVHPLQSEVVNYVTQRTESMMALALLSTLYCSMRAHEHAGFGRWAWAAVTSAVLGTACKESIAMAPLLVLLYDRVFEYGSVAQAIRTRWRLYAALAASWIPLAALVAARARSTAGFSAGVDPLTYLLNQAGMITQYVRLAIWPRPLVLDYGLPQPMGLAEALPELLLVAGFLALTLVALVRWPAAGFVGAVVFLALAPTSSLIPIVSEVGAERRMYVPMMALCALATLAGRAALERATRGLDQAWRRWITVGAAVGILAACTAATVARNRTYGDPVALWEGVVEHRPHGRAQFALGEALVQAGRSADALDHLRLAVADYPDAGFAYGTELFVAGRAAEAIGPLRAFIEAKPRSPDRVPARRLLARALVAEGRLREAAEQFDEVLQLSPADLDAKVGRAEVVLAEQRYAEAAALFEALAPAASTANIELKWGMALAGAGRQAEAVPHWQRTIELDPASASAHLLLADHNLRGGRLTEAEHHAREAVRLAPEDAAARNLLGAALAFNGNLTDAVVQFREALRIRPDDAQARDNLARASQALSSQPQRRP